MDKLYEEVKEITRIAEDMQELMGQRIATSFLAEQLEKTVTLIEQNNTSQYEILSELRTIRRLLETR